MLVLMFFFLNKPVYACWHNLCYITLKFRFEHNIIYIAGPIRNHKPKSGANSGEQLCGAEPPFLHRIFLNHIFIGGCIFNRQMKLHVFMFIEK